jgi:hypothetical protein
MQCHPLEIHSEHKNHEDKEIKDTDSSSHHLSKEHNLNTQYSELEESNNSDNTGINDDDTYIQDGAVHNGYSDYHLGITASIIVILTGASTLIANIAYNAAKNKFGNQIIAGKDFQQAKTDFKQKSSKIWGISYSSSGGVIATGIALVALGATNPFIPAIAVGALLISGVAGILTGKNFANNYTRKLALNQADVNSSSQPILLQDKDINLELQATVSNKYTVEKKWTDEINTHFNNQITL